MLKVNELYQKATTKTINEKATLNRPNDITMPFSIYEVSIHSDDHNPPHFHYTSNDGTLNIKISIETLDVIYSSPCKGISKDKLKSWEGSTTEKKILKNWLKDKSNASPIKMTNYESIIYQWSIFHIDNDIPNGLANPWL